MPRRIVNPVRLNTKLLTKYLLNKSKGLASQQRHPKQLAEGASRAYKNKLGLLYRNLLVRNEKLYRQGRLG